MTVEPPACDVSAVVVCFHPDAATLRECLASIRLGAEDAEIQAEIIVVDNGGTPAGEVEADDVRVLQSPGNVGFAVAANAGIAAATGRWVLLLNPDAALLSGALAEFVKRGESDEEDLFVGWLRSAAGIQVDGLFSWWLSTERALRRPFVRRRLRRLANAGLPVRVSKVSGGALFAKREVLNGLGPFDPTFFLYGEDVDLSLRARRVGRRLVALPAAGVAHTGAASQVSHGELVERARMDAALRLLSKHRPRWFALVGRAELWVVTGCGLVVGGRSSGSRRVRGARVHELRRWGIRRIAPKFEPPAASHGDARILLLAPLLQGGGAQRALEAVIEDLRPRARIKTIVLFRGNRNHERVAELSHEFEEWNLSSGPLGVASAAIRVRREISGADVVLSLTRGSNCVLGLVPAIRTPTVLCQHMLPSLEGRGVRHAIEDLAYRRAVARASAIVVPTRRAEGEMLDAFPDGDGKIRVIANPFTPSDKAVVRPRSRPLAKVNLLFVGRLEYDKGLDRLLPILREAIDRPCELRVAGTGPESEWLGAEAGRPDPRLVIVPLGWRQDVVDLLDWADGVVLPSRAELIPYVVQEAWSRGRPILGSDIPPLVDLAREGPLVALPMNVAEWRKAFMRLADGEHAADAAFDLGQRVARRTEAVREYASLLNLTEVTDR